MGTPAYKYLDKFEIRNADFRVEIQGIYPAGQQLTMQITTNAYRVMLNGIDVILTEDNLNLLKSASKKVEVEEVIEPLEKVGGTSNDEDPIIEKKKMGRPAGSKNK